MPRIRIADVSLYYETAGNGPTLLFLNGLGLTTREWENQVARFSQSFRVVTFDARGHGQSDKPKGPYSISLFALDAAGLIRALDLAPAHLVGLSLGGMIAFQLALDAPELLRSMIIVNSGPEFVLRAARQKFEMLRRKFTIRFLGMRKMGNLLAGRLFPKPEQAELRRKTAATWAENDRRAYLESTRALEGWSVLDRLAEITRPALVISSDGDYSPVAYKEWYAGLMPNAKVAVIPDSRHAAPLDQPELFNRAVADFLSLHP